MSENLPALEGLRIVLLGTAGAGKSSLLGALAQAAQTQQQLLGSQLAEANGGLADLQKRVYDNKQTATQEEIASYPVTMQSDAAVAVTFVDCDGRLAQEYLSGERSLEDRGALANAINSADALVLLVAPGEQGQLEQLFGQLTQFLQFFESQRSRRSEIAGLPVYLVLTKCDLLARKDDTSSAWVQRLEEGKRKIGKRFENFVHRTRRLPFGTIDLRLWATAIRRPALTDRPARADEPYGVAELFRQVVDSARVFHDQGRHALRRLRLVVLGWLGLIGVMGLLAALFFLSRPSAELAALENSLKAALPSPTASAGERLREPLDQKLKELTKIQDNPEFGNLLSRSQEEVRQAIEEIESYQNIGKEVDSLKRVRFFKKDEDIAAYTRKLDKIVLPPEYAASWADTRLVRKMQQYRVELAALVKALAEESDWLKKQVQEGDALRRMAIPAEGSPERQEWLRRADVFLKRKDLTKEVPHVPKWMK